MPDTGTCECGHAADKHGRPRCTALDSYGFRCACDQFILDRSPDDEDDPGDDANDFLQRRSVSQLEEVLHAHDCADFYAKKVQASD